MRTGTYRNETRVLSVQLDRLESCCGYRELFTPIKRARSVQNGSPQGSRTRATGARGQKPYGQAPHSPQRRRARVVRCYVGDLLAQCSRLECSQNAVNSREFPCGCAASCNVTSRYKSGTNRTGDKKGAQRTTANLRAGARMQAVCKRFSWGFALP